MILNELEQIHNLSKAHKIQMTDHALKRANERSIDILTDILPALITEYFPNNIEWEKDFKTRKKGL